MQGQASDWTVICSVSKWHDSQNRRGMVSNWRSNISKWLFTVHTLTREMNQYLPLHALPSIEFLNPPWHDLKISQLVPIHILSSVYICQVEYNLKPTQQRCPSEHWPEFFFSVFLFRSHRSQSSSMKPSNPDQEEEWNSRKNCVRPDTILDL